MRRPAAPLLNSNNEKVSEPSMEANSHYGKAKASFNYKWFRVAVEREAQLQAVVPVPYITSHGR